MCMREGTYTSSLRTHVRFKAFEPSVVIRIKAIVMIWHDLAEDLSQYEHLASFLLQQGYFVVISDYPGHGQSLINFEQGYFGKEDVMHNLVEDMHHLFNVIHHQYAYDDVPCYFIGVGLGASLTRIYASIYGDYIQGMILVSNMKKLTHLRSRQLLLKVLMKLRGEKHRVNLKMLMIDGKKSKNNPFRYTLKGYQDIYQIINTANLLKTINATPTHLEILLLSGNQDLQIRNGDDTKAIYNDYKNRGIEDVNIKIYKNMGHDLLKENNKKNVYKDILAFLNQRSYL